MQLASGNNKIQREVIGLVPAGEKASRLTPLIWIIIIIGIVLRLIQYGINRSLWADEANLALNIVNKSLPELLKPLDFRQVAPVGFLFIEKLNVQLFGDHDYILRLFPLIAGIASIFLFYIVAKHVLKKEAVVIAVGLFALSGHLVYYASEVKQYSCDVAVALPLYALTLIIYSKKNKLPYFILYGIVGAITIWFSNPAVFILAGTGLSLLSVYLIKKEWNNVVRLSVIFSVWLMSFISSYILIVSPLREAGIVGYMQKYWRESFMPLPPLSVSDFQWYYSNFFGIFSDPGGITVKGIASLAFLIGCKSMVERNRQWFFMLMSPVVITLLASGFHIYPFNGRLLLFLVPSLLLIIAEGTEYIKDRTKSSSSLIGAMFIGLLFFHPILSITNNVITWTPYHHSRPIQDIKSVMNYHEKHTKDGDIIYVYWASTSAFQYYAKQYGLNTKEYILGKESRDNWRGYCQDLDKLHGKKRVWLIFSHVQKSGGVNEEELFIQYLDGFGTRLDHVNADGAAIYLYDLSSGDRNQTSIAPLFE